MSTLTSPLSARPLWSGILSAKTMVRLPPMMSRGFGTPVRVQSRTPKVDDLVVPLDRVVLRVERTDSHAPRAPGLPALADRGGRPSQRRVLARSDRVTLLHDHSLPERRGVPLFAMTLEPSGGVAEPTEPSGKIALLGGGSQRDVRR